VRHFQDKPDMGRLIESPRDFVRALIMNRRRERQAPVPRRRRDRREDVGELDRERGEG